MKSSTGFCSYSDHVSSSGNPITIQGFVSDPFNFTTGMMDMMGFSSKNILQQQSSDDDNNKNDVMCKTFLGKHGQHAAGPSSSKTMNESSTTDFYHHHQPADHFTSIPSSEEENLIVAGTGAHESAPWQQNKLINVVDVDDDDDDDDDSLRCLFPCEGKVRPSQGLSLSLNSANPSSIGLQSFQQIKPTTTTTTGNHHDHEHRQDYFVSGKYSTINENQILLQEGVNNVYEGHFLLKNSKLLVPVQELLNEFCSLEPTQINDFIKQKSQKKREFDENGAGSSHKKHSVISSIEFVELERRKTELLSLLEELERRYRHYRNQMKELVSWFEAVAGYGAAIVYSALAMKAMSRHFRSLKDGIVDQIESTRKALMGERSDAATATATPTPRLRVIDQALRQQRALQEQINMNMNMNINMMMELTHPCPCPCPWKPQRGLPERSVSILRAWLFEHFLHPYPSDVDKHILARQAGLSRSQVSNWFINARVRLWKPMVEEMYLEEEARERENNKNDNVASSSSDHQEGAAGRGSLRGNKPDNGKCSSPPWNQQR